MSICITRIFFLVSLFVHAMPTAAQSPSLTGEWEVYFRTPRGPLNLKVRLRQEGEKLSGVAPGPNRVIIAHLQGSIRGKEVNASCTLELDGSNSMEITITGQLDGDSLKGKADFGGVAVGDWSAKRVAGGAIPDIDKATDSNAQLGEKINVSGTWRFEVETDLVSNYPTCTFRQEGDTVVGYCKGVFGEAPLTGTVKDNEIKFSYVVHAQDAEVSIRYIGTIKQNLMEGISRFDETYVGSWTAKRQ